MKKFLIPVIFLAILAFGLVAIGFFWWEKNSKSVSNDKTLKDFLVVKGRGASQISQKLYEEGLIRNPLAFKIYVQITGKADKIQEGEFRVSPSYSLEEIVNTLTSGPVELWVTIPEGLRREEIVERFIEGLKMSTADGIIFRQDFLDLTKDMEGFLFPDTYLFPRDISAKIVLDTMRATFDKRISEFEAEVASSELSLSEIVTLSSIIERETKSDAERPIVAGILLNRLNIGMPLQADATAQYAISSAKCIVHSAKCDWWPVLIREDLTIDSPYNTYKFTGLPPKPIANPGLSSLKAVILPEDSDYLYYIHDQNGNTYYAKTLPEHNENVKRYLGN